MGLRSESTLRQAVGQQAGSVCSDQPGERVRGMSFEEETTQSQVQAVLSRCLSLGQVSDYVVVKGLKSDRLQG